MYWQKRFDRENPNEKLEQKILEIRKENKDFVNIKFKELIDIINDYELYFRDNKILEI